MKTSDLIKLLGPVREAATAAVDALQDEEHAEHDREREAARAVEVKREERAVVAIERLAYELGEMNRVFQQVRMEGLRLHKI